ncbi:hypothetical protein Desde_3981 [Desulfitobacterium dehalogenans ATCC 51507]|uniref:Uncharacterized protein n=1 Tax=Desulfitobacterium dehalogenans (strain ATCC 51507 / DSM 9161 / JW/IU-DC1) TaxID=756499 RepID=I4AE60_DESDJ|nr:PH domain-containing protein [Desulfitobacterium dehalogenans]AFM02245.1 hypothetical protein Desde_3981 [Desulfitobacterium dehalogenans ATCC 51507]
MQEQIDLIERSLLKGEKLLAVGASFPDPTEQVYVTDKRIIVQKIKGFNSTKKEIPLSAIGSVNKKFTLFHGGTLQIVASNDSATVEKIPLDVLQEVKRIIDELLNQPVQDDSVLQQAPLPEQITVNCPGCGATNIK